MNRWGWENQGLVYGALIGMAVFLLIAWLCSL
jgi:hypothetical protein